MKTNERPRKFSKKKKLTSTWYVLYLVRLWPFVAVNIVYWVRLALGLRASLVSYNICMVSNLTEFGKQQKLERIW